MNCQDLINNKVGTVQYILDANDLRILADEIIARLQEKDQSQPSKSDDELLTRKGVMDYLGVKSTTLWQWAKLGILNPVKIKRKYFYRKSDILALQSGDTNNINNNLNCNS